MMKKLISIALSLVLFCSVAVVGVSAASTPKDKILSAFKDSVHEYYYDVYGPTLDNILSQVTVTDAQADEIVALIDDFVEDFDVKHPVKDADGKYTGMSLDEFSSAQKKLFMNYLDKGCGELQITYEIVSNPAAKHTGDVTGIFYFNNTKLAEIDGDMFTPIKQTDEVSTNYLPYGLLAAAVLMLTGAGFCFKKLKTNETR